MEVVDKRLALEVEDLDGGSGSSTEPVSVGGEDESVDNVSGVERVEVLALVEVPEHGDTVLTTGGSEGTVGRDGEGVKVTGVTVVGGLQLAVGELPDLNGLVPTSRDDDGEGGVRGESNAGDPLGVAVLDNVKLALSKGVPELDGSVSGGRNNLTVVSRERDGENVASVADKLLGRQTSVKVPQPKGVVPRGRKSKLAVGRDGNVGHKVVVTVENLLGETVQVVLSGELPSNDSLVY